MANINDVAKTCIQLLLAEPFYGHYLTGVPKEISEEISTAAVGLMERQMVKLMVNSDFWDGLNEDTRYGLIKHEVLHIVFNHLITQRDYSHKRLFNIAADVVVNQYINKDQLPEGGITFERLEHYKKSHGIEWERDKDVGYYYRQLLKVQQNSNSGTGQGSGQSSDTPMRNPNGDLDLSDLLSEDNSELDKHKFWEAFKELSPAEAKMLEKQMESIFKQSMIRIRGQKVHHYGYMSAGLREKLETKLASLDSVINWKRVLRLFACTSNSSFVKNTLRRPSKRYGTTPGIKVKRRNKLLVVLDTSGSIQMPEVEEFFGEIHQIWRQGSEIYIIECDVKIHKEYPYRGQLPPEIKGRGGNDSTPPIVFANEKYRPDAILFFTDGYVPAPRIDPRCPLLWIISSSGIAIDDPHLDKLQGQKLKIVKSV